MFANKFLRIYYGTVKAYLNQLDFLNHYFLLITQAAATTFVTASFAYLKISKYIFIILGIDIY